MTLPLLYTSLRIIFYLYIFFSSVSEAVVNRVFITSTHDAIRRSDSEGMGIIEKRMKLEILYFGKENRFVEKALNNLVQAICKYSNVNHIQAKLFDKKVCF